MYLQSRVFSASLPLSPSEGLLSIPASRSRHCAAVRYCREKQRARTTTTNNNKLDRYEVCRALSVRTYLPATCFSDIVTRPSSVIVPIYSHDSFYSYSLHVLSMKVCYCFTQSCEDRTFGASIA